MKKENVLFSDGLDSVMLIIKKASHRLSDRFIAYIRVYIATIGLFIALGLAFAGVSLSFFAIAKTIHFNLLYILVVPLLLAFLCGFIYLSTWCSLATIDSIIGKTRISLKERFNTLRPRVVGFIWYNGLLGLFFLGLLPFGILTVGLVFLFWIVISSFSAFIYLEHQQHGLNNLWVSKQMMQNQFWKIFFLFVVVYAIVFSIDIVLLRSNHPVTHFTSWMLNLVTTPFLLALTYEIYHQIPYPQTIQKPKNWLVLSKIGFVLFVIGGILLIRIAIQTYPTWHNIPSSSPSPIDLYKLI